MKDVRGRSALHLAASTGHADVLSHLLSAADRTHPHHVITDCHGFTPAHWSAYHGTSPAAPCCVSPTRFICNTVVLMATLLPLSLWSVSVLHLLSL